MAKGELSRVRKRNGERRNRDTIAGKMALFETYAAMGLEDSDAAKECWNNIQRQRAYLKNRTGDAE